MKLYYSTASPFARKVNITAIALGLDKDIQLVSTDVYGPNSSYVDKVNPLNKVPALETRDGQILINSPFICEYLCHLAGDQQFLPSYGPSRWRILHHQAVGDGILDAAVLRRYEFLRRPDRKDELFDNRQADKIEQGLKYFSDHIAEFKSNMNLGGITLLCAIEYLDFRFAADQWLRDFPRLNEWYDQHKNWPPYKSTRPS